MKKSNKGKSCCICGHTGGCIEIGGKYYCNKHYQSMHNWGTPYGHPREKTNTYEIIGGIMVITTAKGNKIIADSDDYEKLSKHSWCISKTGYPVANIDGKTTKMSRFILDLNDTSMVIDHINNCPLDNRKCNMRVCTPKENSRNKTPKHNICGIRRRKSGKYSVRIMVDRKEITIGTFDTYRDAVTARLNAESFYFGQYAHHINSIDQWKQEAGA